MIRLLKGLGIIVLSFLILVLLMIPTVLVEQYRNLYYFLLYIPPALLYAYAIGESL